MSGALVALCVGCIDEGAGLELGTAWFPGERKAGVLGCRRFDTYVGSKRRLGMLCSGWSRVVVGVV